MIRFHRDADGVRKVIAGTDGHNSKNGALGFGQLHDPVDDFMNRAVSAHCDDHVIALFTSLLGKFRGMGWIYRSAPICVAIIVEDGTQIIGDFPGIAHVGHGIQNDFDFAAHWLIYLRSEVENDNPCK